MVEERWINDTLTEAHAYFTSVDQRERAADERTKALIRVHEDGWKLVARSLDTGLRAIAEAIRGHGRR